MKPEEIKAELMKQGYTQGMLAEVLSCTPSLVCKVINRKAQSYRIALAVAKSISLPIDRVFPEIEYRPNRNCENYKAKIQQLKEIIHSA